MSNDETRFNELKVQCGSEDEADKVTLEEYAALSDKRAETLVDRIPNAKIAGEISAIRKRAIQASKASQRPVPQAEDKCSIEYFRVTGVIEDSRTSKGYQSTIYKCAQDAIAFYCEEGPKKSIYYEEDSRDLTINLLFMREDGAYAFQNSLVNFKFTHPSFGSKIHIEETVNKVHLPTASTRVFYHHYEGADNESPVLSLADIRHVLSSEEESVSYDPVKALQSFEDITVFPGTKFYWCHLLSRQSKKDKSDENNCIWGSWTFYQYFDALNTEVVGVPLIAVKYISTSEQPEDLPVGDKYETRRKVMVEIHFFNSDIGRRVALAFRSLMKIGTEVKDTLCYESYFYPKDPVKMQNYLDIKYAATMKAWEEELM